MADQDLSVRWTANGFWGVYTCDGAVISELPSKPQAITQAVSLLARSKRGGVLTVFDAEGNAASPIRVEAAPKNTSSRPTISDSSTLGQPRSRRQPATGQSLVDEPDSENPAQEPVEKMTEFADRLLGREEPPKNAGSELLDLSVTELIPQRYAGNKTVKMVNTHVSIGAAWCLIVTFILTGGTLSAAVAPAFQAAAGKATVGSYATFGQAFFATFALSISAMIVMVLFRQNALQGAGGLFFVAFIILAVVWVCAENGIGGPSPNVMAAAIGRGGNPWTIVSAELRVFSTYYGPAPYLAGIVVGALTGNICYNISKAEIAE